MEPSRNPIETQSQPSRNPVATQSVPNGLPFGSSAPNNIYISTSTTNTKEEEEAIVTTRRQPTKPESVSASVWADWVAHRKAKRAPVTATVIAAIEREAKAANWTLEQALVEVVTRGWQGFKAEWVNKGKAGRSFGEVDYRAGVNDDGTL